MQRWGCLGVLDYEWVANKFLQVPGGWIPWVYEGLTATSTNELHVKVVNRLKQVVAQAAEKEK